MAIIMLHDESLAEAWDCDPDAALHVDAYDLELDEEADETDWQVLVLDRFGDRTVDESLHHRGDPTQARCW